jgi:hypothetical protein
MKIKTSELSGIALDWAVALAEGHDYSLNMPEMHCDGGLWNEQGPWNPSTNWSQGVPIIDRERIRVDWPLEDSYNASCKIDGVTALVTGATALEAAMRCLVASKLGDEVEIPEELL